MARRARTAMRIPKARVTIVSAVITMVKTAVLSIKSSVKGWNSPRDIVRMQA